MNVTSQHWIGVDWGTSNLRLWIMDQEGHILKTLESPVGMVKLEPHEFEPHLMMQLEDYIRDLEHPITVLCAGMVGAKQGWQETPYLPVPINPCEKNIAQKVPTKDPRVRLFILSGICQHNPADVMRGEETQISGYLSDHPHWDGVICLPGAHSKWVHASAGEIVSFQTYMTGEIFSLLSQHSVLRHIVSERDRSSTHDEAFLSAIDRAMARPERVAALLFSLQAQDLIRENEPTHHRETLLGLLLGLELAAARPYWLGQDIVLIGAPALSEHYQKALQHLGMQATCADAVLATQKGLLASFRKLETGHTP